MNEIVLYIAAALTAVWGISHLFATKGVIAGFGELTADNRRIITMEWVVEGVALIATGAFVAAATAAGHQSPGSRSIYGVAIGTLVILAGVSLLTGFRIAFWPFKLCPFIFGTSAILIALGAWL